MLLVSFFTNTTPLTPQALMDLCGGEASGLDCSAAAAGPPPAQTQIDHTGMPMPLISVVGHAHHICRWQEN